MKTRLLLAVLLTSARLSFGAPAEPVVHYADDRLSVRLEDTPRQSMLDHLARATGAEIRGSLPDEGPVSARFDRLPLQDALERLLGKGSFALRYARDGRLKAIELLGAGDPNARIVPPGEARLTSTQMFERLYGDTAIPLDGGLARLLGPTATFRQLGDVAVNNPDAQMRRDAVSRMLRAIDSDQQLRRAVEDKLRSSDDAAMLMYARVAGGVYAEEMLEQVSSQGKGEIATRAKTTLEKLRAERAAR